MNFKLALAIGLAVVVTGCSSVDPGMGEALKYDMAVQTIDPDPVYAEDGAKPGDSGEHGAEAVKRYRKGQVKQVDVIGTSSSSGGGGSPQ